LASDPRSAGGYQAGRKFSVKNGFLSEVSIWKYLEPTTSTQCTPLGFLQGTNTPAGISEKGFSWFFGDLPTSDVFF
jgi:hypothetical protein